MQLPEFSANIEKDLLIKVSEGSEPAFAELFNRHHQHLATFIYHLTTSRELAEEVVQDVFLKVWNSRQSLREIDNFRAWLFVISKHHALNCLRKAVRDRIKHSEWITHQSSLNQVTETNVDERTALAARAIEQLSPQQKKVYILSRIGKLRYEEIARQLNLSRETVKSYLKLASSSISKFVNSHSSFFIFWLILFGILRG